MAARQIIFLILMICLPLGLLVWFGWRLAHHEQAVVREQLHRAIVQQLRETDRTVVRLFEQREVDLLRITESLPLEAGSIRELVRREPQVRQAFVINSSGTLIHPNPNTALNQFEQKFLVRIDQLVKDKDLVAVSRVQVDPYGYGQAALNQAATQSPAGKRVGTSRLPLQKSTPQKQTTQAQVSYSQNVLSPQQDDASGWYTWYWGRGLNIVFWRRFPTGHVLGVELEGSRWRADLIGELPDTPIELSLSESDVTDYRIRLENAEGEAVYQWGTFEPTTDAQPLAELSLSPPLASWRFKYHAPEQPATLSSTSFNILSALLIAGLGVCGLCFFFVREYSRNMREARQRVNFVNQVSHELKTPLTNIRMYADLLEDDISAESDEPSPSKRHLQVIRNESQRLSRLIGNVLTFAKQQRESLQIQRRRGCVDDVIRRVIEQFRPSLSVCEVEVATDLGVPQTIDFDSDALEQILSNLISNVEKYAASGKHLFVASRMNSGKVAIDVIDHGPGVPREQQDRIFEPFVRLSHRLEDAAGTGIGLSIARRLARLHDGDLRLIPSDAGSHFRIEFLTC